MLPARSPRRWRDCAPAIRGDHRRPRPAPADLFIVDRHPFGIDGELAEALDRRRVHGTRTVLGLREVLDDPAVIAGEWDRVGGPDAVARAFDEVWVYGDPEVYDPAPPAKCRPNWLASPG